MQRQSKARLSAYNIFDKLYSSGGYNNNPNRVLPGVPVSATVTLRYSFN